MKSSKEIIAENIRKYMDAKGVSNLDVCAALDIKYTTYLDWVNAKAYPRIGKIELLANYFGCQKSDLIEEKLTAEQLQNNDLIADVVVRMRIDEEFCKAVEKLYKMDGAKIAGFNSMFGSQDK